MNSNRLTRLAAPLFKAIACFGLITIQGLGIALANISRVEFAPVFVYESQTTKQYLEKQGARYEVLLKSWLDLLPEIGLTSTRLTKREDIDKIAPASVLILPSAIALNEAERRSISSFHQRGGAVLVTWATGTRDAKGEWLGWNYLRSWGAEVVDEMPTQANTRHLNLPGESPINQGLGAGTRIWMTKATEPILRIRPTAPQPVGTVPNSSMRVSGVGQFLDWARIVDPNRKTEAAIVIGESNVSGRSAVFSFPESTWEGKSQPMQSLIKDTLRWLSRKPVAVVAAWPKTFSSAMLIQMDTEEGFANSLLFSAHMRAAELRPTYYLLSSLAKTNPAVVQQLAQGAELGLHGDIHTSFKGLSRSTQEKRFQTSRSDLAGINGVNLDQVLGFRAPTEGYDGLTEEIMQRLGFRHHVADPERSESRLPLFAKVPGTTFANDVVVLPRTQRDDINFSLQGLTGETLLKAIIDDFEQARTTGSMGLLSLHSQNYGAESPFAKAMPQFFEFAKSHRSNVWFPSSSEVEQWWRDRERISLSSRTQANRVVLQVTVSPGPPVKGVNLILTLPQIDIKATVANLPSSLGTVQLDQLDPWRIVLRTNNLPAGRHDLIVEFSR